MIIRQARQVCWACAAFARPARWPIGTQATQVFRHIRTLQTSSARSSTTNPIEVTGAPADASAPHADPKKTPDGPSTIAEVANTSVDTTAPPPSRQQTYEREKTKARFAGASRPGPWWRYKRRRAKAKKIRPISRWTDRTQSGKPALDPLLKMAPRDRRGRRIGGRERWIQPSSLHRMRERLKRRHLQPGQPVEEITKNIPFEVRQAHREWDHKLRVLWYRMKHGQTGETEHFKGEGMEDLKLLLQCNSVESMRAAWFGGKRLWQRKRDWENMILSAMHFYPERTPELLLATIDLHITPAEFVVDTICYLFERASLLPAREQEERQLAIARLLLDILGPFPPRYFTFPQWLLGRVASVSPAPLVKRLHWVLFSKYHPFDWNTQFKFASRLARDPKGKGAALRILEKMIVKSRRMGSSRRRPTGKKGTRFLRFITLGGGRVYQWVKLDDPNFQRRFAELATAIVSVPEGWKHSGEGSPFTLQLLNTRFKRLIDIGIPLNHITQTAMLQAICSTGDLDAAWNLYHHMLEQGNKPDVRPYLLLLNAAKRAGSIESIMRVILDAPAEVLQSRYIWNEVLSAVLTVATQECIEKKVPRPRTVPAFDFMLQIYKKFFKLEPLDKLLPSHLLTPFDTTYPWDWRAKLAVVMDKLPARRKRKLVNPGADTLRIMLHGYVKGLSNASLLVNFYAHFRTLLKDGDPYVLELLRDSTQPYDVIIKAVTDHPGLLKVAADILNDMLRDAGAATASGKMSDPSEEHSQTVQGRHAKARRRRRRKNSRSHRSTEGPFVHPLPSVHTWNAILAGFFRERRVRQSWRIFELMRQHGVEPNKVTWNTLIAGYTATRENQLAVETLVQFEKLGYKADESIQRQMSILSKHGPTRRLMEEADNQIQMSRHKWKIFRTQKRLAEMQARREEHLRKIYTLGMGKFPTAAAAAVAAAKAADEANAAGKTETPTETETKTGEKEEELSPTADFFKMYDELIFQAEQQ